MVAARIEQPVAQSGARSLPGSSSSADREGGKQVAGNLTEILAKLKHGREQMNAALRENPLPSDRARRIAEVLATAWPSSPVHASLLWHDNQPHVCILDATRRPRPDWHEVLFPEVGQYDGATEGGTLNPHPLPEEMQTPRHVLAAQPISHGEDWLGTLAVAVADDAPGETRAILEALLTGWAEHLALALALEALQKWQTAQAEDLAS